MAEAVSRSTLQKLQKEYEDVLVQLVVCSYAEQLGQEYLSEIQQLNQSSGPVPREALRRLHRAQRRSSFRVHSKAIYQASKRVLQTAAMFVLAILVAFSFTMVTVEAARKKVFSFISQWSEDLSSFTTQIEGVGSTDSPYIPTPARPEMSFAWLPDSLPEGYVEENRSVIIPGVQESVIYRKSETEDITLDLTELQVSASLDIENADRIEKFAINDGDGYLIQKNGYTTIWWNDGNYQYSISGTISMEEALKLAEETGF